MVWGDIMTSFWPMCVLTSAIARFIPIFKLEYFWNAKTYTGEILIWCHIDGVLSEKPQNTHNLNCLFFNGCLGWKFKNCWNDCNVASMFTRTCRLSWRHLDCRDVIKICGQLWSQEKPYMKFWASFPQIYGFQQTKQIRKLTKQIGLTCWNRKI